MSRVAAPFARLPSLPAIIASAGSPQTKSRSGIKQSIRPSWKCHEWAIAVSFNLPGTIAPPGGGVRPCKLPEIPSISPLGISIEYPNGAKASVGSECPSMEGGSTETTTAVCLDGSRLFLSQGPCDLWTLQFRWFSGSTQPAQNRCLGVIPLAAALVRDSLSDDVQCRAGVYRKNVRTLPLIR